MDLWPAQVLQNHVAPPHAALIILNRPILSLELLKALWPLTTYRVCADGGANRLFDALAAESLPSLLSQFQPDAIVGDFDSVRPDVLSFYEPHVDMVKDSDLYSTDLAKSFRQVYSTKPDLGMHGNVIIMGSLSGRVDQGIGMVHEMYREVRLQTPAPSPPMGPASPPQYMFWLISESNISIILGPGEHVLHGLQANRRGEESKRVFTPNVGILPLFGPSVITTKGLEWDVTDWATSMGGQVSTSNHVIADSVRMTTDSHVLFTIELADWKL